MLKIDLHTHTIASGHAFNTIYEMAKAASDKGVEILGITDHGPDVYGSAHKGYFECLERMPRKLFGVKMLYGVELCLKDRGGTLDLPDEVLEKLDYASGFHLHLSPEILNDQKAATDAILKGMANPYLKIMPHLYWPSRPCVLDIEQIAQAACDNGKLLEISAVHFEYGDKKIVELDEIKLENLKKMVRVIKRNKHKVLISSDSHVASEVGIDSGVNEHMQTIGLTDDDIANNNIEYLRKIIKKI